jgi:hypothetical protein
MLFFFFIILDAVSAIVPAALVAVSMFIFIPVSFFMLVSAAGAIAGVVAVVDVLSVVLLAVFPELHAATANAATMTKRFIYDLLESGGDLS